MGIVRGGGVWKGCLSYAIVWVLFLIPARLGGLERGERLRDAIVWCGYYFNIRMTGET